MGAPLHKRLRRMEAQIRSNKPELKHIHSQGNGTIVTTAGSNDLTVHMTDIGQGSGVTTRTGNEVLLKWLEFRGYIAPGVDVFVLQCLTTSAPTTTDFTSSEGSMLATANWNTRFRELMHFNASSLGADGGYFSKRLNLRNLKVKYNGSSTTSDVVNRIYIYCINNTGSGAIYTFNTRMFFTDA